MLDNNIRHEAKNYFTAPRCKLCFDKLNLFADIVYGDAWGVSGDDTRNGGNVIICRTPKGEELIEEMLEKGRIVGRPCSIEEIAKGQGMKNKKKTVDKMLHLYHQKSFQVPRWAKDDVFKEDSIIPEKLQKDVDDYLKRSKKNSEQIVAEVTKKIRRKLFMLRIKRFVKQLIKR